MCGRMSRLFSSENKKLHEFFMISKVKREFGPSYNVAPTQEVPVVVPGSTVLTTMRWGLIPFWAKDMKIGAKMINARSETLEDKPSFRTCFQKKRCIIPASSFYEWDKSKKPYNITVKGEEFIGFAGLWDEWKDKATGEVIQSVTIITADANDYMKRIHHRMPVILKREDFQTWLNPKTHVDDLRPLLKPFGSELEAYEISKAINKPANNKPELLKPLDEGFKQKTLF